MSWLIPIGVACLHIRSHRRLPLPPGPRGYPIVGNLLNIPRLKPWLTFKDWCNVYGDVVYLNLPMRPTIILGSAKAAFDLLEKRSDNYSDRHLNAMTELSGWGFNFGLMRYSQRWRTHRRVFHQYLNQHSSLQWRSVQVDESQKFLRRVLDDLDNIDGNTRLIIYGMHIESTDDYYMQIVRKASQGFSAIAVPGLYWVDYFPILRKLPEWFPGTQWKQVANQIREWTNAMRLSPLQAVFDRIENDTVEHCVVAAALSKARERHKNPEEQAVQEEIVADVAGVAYTNTAAQYFYIAMTLYPHVQKAAQAELDTVVGSNRLPTFDDFDKLVYIQAVVMEWHPVLPLGLTHRTLRDDNYNGYFIPAGTEVIPVTIIQKHCADYYPNPMEFKPERFIKDGKIDPNVRDLATIAFGFGRRICAGRHLASSSLFLIVALTLHVFDIVPKEGESFDTETMIGTGLLSVPTKVPVVVRPRSRDIERLVRDFPKLSD
ncbi:cytochrome P450 [Panus rudis PR-1116 ss-1]|nr:cytochrome P450 [Panus rudis PR-1116 ss-1]